MPGERGRWSSVRRQAPQWLRPGRECRQAGVGEHTSPRAGERQFRLDPLNSFGVEMLSPVGSHSAFHPLPPLIHVTLRTLTSPLIPVSLTRFSAGSAGQSAGWSGVGRTLWAHPAPLTRTETPKERPQPRPAALYEEVSLRS